MRITIQTRSIALTLCAELVLQGANFRCTRLADAWLFVVLS